jgi:hypothetical protein
MPKIKFKRGLKENLPDLDEGEPGFAKDTEELFIGTETGNIQLAKKESVDTLNLEIDNARGGLPALKDRLDGVDQQLSDKVSQAALNETNAIVTANTTALAESTHIQGTTQNIIWNTDGTVQKVQHVDSNNTVLREDVFTYSTNLITEVRTVGTNSITFKYHLDTLQTEVI